MWRGFIITPLLNEIPDRNLFGVLDPNLDLDGMKTSLRRSGNSLSRRV
jgi:hypothetical protein